MTPRARARFAFCSPLLCVGGSGRCTTMAAGPSLPRTPPNEVGQHSTRKRVPLECRANCYAPHGPYANRRGACFMLLSRATFTRPAISERQARDLMNCPQPNVVCVTK